MADFNDLLRPSVNGAVSRRCRCTYGPARGASMSRVELRHGWPHGDCCDKGCWICYPKENREPMGEVISDLTHQCGDLAHRVEELKRVIENKDEVLRHMGARVQQLSSELSRYKPPEPKFTARQWVKATSSIWSGYAFTVQRAEWRKEGRFWAYYLSNGNWFSENQLELVVQP